MENIEVKTFEAQIIKLPRSFFIIGVTIITLSLVTFFFVSILIGYSDHYSVSTWFKNEHRDTIKLIEIPQDMLNKIKLNEKVVIQFTDQKVAGGQNGEVIKIDTGAKTITVKCNQDFKRMISKSDRSLIHVNVKFISKKQNILQRIIGGKSS